MSKRKQSSNFYRRVKACTENDIAVINEKCSFVSNDCGETSKLKSNYCCDLPSSSFDNVASESDDNDINTVNENENPESTFSLDDDCILNNMELKKKIYNRC